MDGYPRCHEGWETLWLLRNASFNFLALDAEGDLLDTRPQLMFLPVLDIEQLRSWNGAGYNAVVIAANAWGYQRAGSCQETQCAERQALQTAFATFAAVGRSLCKLYMKRIRFAGGSKFPRPLIFHGSCARTSRGMSRRTA